MVTGVNLKARATNKLQLVFPNQNQDAQPPCHFPFKEKRMPEVLSNTTVLGDRLAILAAGRRV
jgi:hypothetical protein